MSPKEKSKELITLMFQPIFDIDGGVHTAHDKGRYIAAIKCAIKSVEEMLNNELLTDLLQLPDDSPHKYKAIYQKMWLTDVKNELLKQQNNG